MESFDVEIDAGLFYDGLRSANETDFEVDRYTTLSDLALSASGEGDGTDEDYSDRSVTSHGGSTDEEISILYSMYPRRSTGLRQICEVPLNTSQEKKDNGTWNLMTEHPINEEHELELELDTGPSKPKSSLLRNLGILGIILILVFLSVLTAALVMTRPTNQSPNAASHISEDTQSEEQYSISAEQTAVVTNDKTLAPSFGALSPPTTMPSPSPTNKEEDYQNTAVITASPTMSPHSYPTATGNGAWAHFLGILSPYTAREFLLDASRPQGRAFLQLIMDNVDSYDTMSSTNVVQSYSILTLYFSTSPKVWDSFLASITAPPLSANDYRDIPRVVTKSAVCTWEGLIDCVENSFGESVVSSITLNDAELSGVLPEEICLLEHLERLDLRSNALAGSIPSCLVDSTSLKMLLLSDNSLTSDLPHGILLIPTLEELEVDNNHLVGNLENLIAGSFVKNIYRYGETWRLRRLNLDNNNFSGEVPAFLGALGNLKSLTLHGNDLTGKVDKMICDRTRSGLVVLTVDCDEVTCPCCSSCYR